MMPGLPGPPSGDLYRRQELQTQLGLDQQREALRELERERKGRLQRLSFTDEVVLAAFIIALVLVVGVGLALLKS
jgi:hypothetical protein